MEDKNITCRDCGKSFVFSVSEQQFYKEKGLQHEPVRCKKCREAKKNLPGTPGKGAKQMHKVTCSNCGKETQVPFKPTQQKPVYCRDCFQKQK